MLGGIRLPNGSVTEGKRSEMHLRRRHAVVATSLDLSDKTVLDVGCNNGLYALYMAQSAKYVYGVDRFKARIDEASQLAGALQIDNVTFLAGDIRDSQILSQIPKVDLIVLWGFLHRVPDIFSILFSLTKLTEAFSLEWQTPVFPGMKNMPIAVYPETRDLELGNLTGLDKTIINSGDEVRRMMQNTFWEPTPRAVQSISSDLGFPFTHIIGYDDGLVTEEAMLARRFDNDGKRRKDLPERKRLHPETIDVARVHMIVEKEFGAIELRSCGLGVSSIPEWDIGMIKQVGMPRKRSLR